MAVPTTQRLGPRLADELSTTDVEITDDTELVDLVVSGDHSNVTASSVELAGCRIERAQMLGAHLRRARFIDCVVTGCDLSGLVLEECVATRVEFHDSRLSAVQAAGGRFQDVAFFDCRLDGANFRMSSWERAQFENCEMAETDFYASTLPETRFWSCDLTGALLSKSTLQGSHFRRSTLEGVKGADSLRGVTISSDLILPVAMAVFSSLGIAVDDA